MPLALSTRRTIDGGLGLVGSLGVLALWPSILSPLLPMQSLPVPGRLVSGGILQLYDTLGRAGERRRGNHSLRPLELRVEGDRSS